LPEGVKRNKSSDTISFEVLTMTQEDKIKPISEKRRYPRIYTFNTINYLLFDSKGEQTGQGKGVTINLSQSGVLLQTEDELEGAFVILMAIDLDGNDIKIYGKIITSRVCKKTNSHLTGIEFVGANEKLLSAVIVFVKDFQRRKRKVYQERLRMKNH
jgi:hypothetical protein